MTKQPEGWEEKLISIIGNYGIFSKSASILYEEIHIAVGGTPEDMLFGNLKFFISQEIKRAERNGIKLCEEVVKEALQDKEMAKNPDDPEIRAIYLLKELELLSKSIKEE